MTDFQYALVGIWVCQVLALGVVILVELGTLALFVFLLFCRRVDEFFKRIADEAEDERQLRRGCTYQQLRTEWGRSVWKAWVPKS